MQIQFSRLKDYDDFRSALEREIMSQYRSQNAFCVAHGITDRAKLWRHLRGELRNAEYLFYIVDLLGKEIGIRDKIRT